LQISFHRFVDRTSSALNWKKRGQENFKFLPPHVRAVYLASPSMLKGGTQRGEVGWCGTESVSPRVRHTESPGSRQCPPSLAAARRRRRPPTRRSSQVALPPRRNTRCGGGPRAPNRTHCPRPAHGSIARKTQTSGTLHLPREKSEDPSRLRSPRYDDLI